MHAGGVEAAVEGDPGIGLAHVVAEQGAVVRDVGRLVDLEVRAVGDAQRRDRHQVDQRGARVEARRGRRGAAHLDGAARIGREDAQRGQVDRHLAHRLRRVHVDFAGVDGQQRVPAARAPLVQARARTLRRVEVEQHEVVAVATLAGQHAVAVVEEQRGDHRAVVRGAALIRGVDHVVDGAVDVDLLRGETHGLEVALGRRRGLEDRVPDGAAVELLAVAAHVVAIGGAQVRVDAAVVDARGGIAAGRGPGAIETAPIGRAREVAVDLERGGRHQAGGGRGGSRDGAGHDRGEQRPDGDGGYRW